jgi:DNA polymerase-3 subunit alpha
MFATLDDLEGQVELLIFGGALERLAGSLDVDAIVLVRGRVDHKEADKTTIVAQSIEPFAPDPEEIARASAAVLEAARPRLLHVQVSEARRSTEFLDELKHVLAAFPGRAEVVVELGDTSMRLGEKYRVEPSVGLRAELEQLLGAPARLVA